MYGMSFLRVHVIISIILQEETTIHTGHPTLVTLSTKKTNKIQPNSKTPLKKLPVKKKKGN
jgi:hypothetical protein